MKAKLKNMYKRLIEKLKTLRIYDVICRFRAEQKRNDIEMKYKYMFDLLDLDWYGYLELQRMKKRELSENGL
jgi:hypothetical protein